MANFEQNRGDRDNEQLRKLFIGGLSPNVGEDELRQHFEQWGDLVDVVVMKDRGSGRSRGFGFVTYKDEECVDRAQANRPHILDGKEVETKRAMPRGEETNMRVEKLFIGGLKPEVTKEQLQEYFSAYGEVVSAEIATMRETGKPRGFGFVTFSDADHVDKAILHRPHDIGSSLRVDCKKALSREQMAEMKARQQMQYGYMGGRGGFMGGRGGFMGGRGGGFMGGRSGGYGGYGGYDDQGASYSGGYDDGYGSGGYGGSGDGMYENGSGFGSYDNQGYGGGPSKGAGGFGGGPQRFQPYGGMRGGPMGSRGSREGGRGMSGGFRGSRGGRGYDY